MAEFKQCQDCERPSNNQYFNCPPRMADGRHFTDYRPRCAQQFQEKLDQGMMSSYEYRMYLTQHAEDLILRNAVQAYTQNRCGPCVEPYDQGTMVPEYQKQSCNARTCTFSVQDPYGLGLGRQFGGEDEEIKKRFLAEKEKETNYFKQNAQCCGTLQDDMQYYPIDGVVATGYQRPSVPGGGVPMTGGDLLRQ